MPAVNIKTVMIMTLTVSKESKSKKRDTNMQQVQDTIESKVRIRRLMKPRCTHSCTAASGEPCTYLGLYNTCLCYSACGTDYYFAYVILLERCSNKGVQHSYLIYSRPNVCTVLIFVQYIHIHGIISFQISCTSWACHF